MNGSEPAHEEVGVPDRSALMSEELVRTFFTDELTTIVGELLLAAISNRKEGREYFTFNVVNVLVDVDAQIVVLDDELSPGVTATFLVDEFAARVTEYRQWKGRVRK